MPVRFPIVYALIADGLILYVGSTILTVHERAMQHRQKSNTSGTKNIPKHIDWNVVVLEEVKSKDKKVLRQREQYYYETLHPLYNACRPYGKVCRF
jgi:hypothetical protein